MKVLVVGSRGYVGAVLLPFLNKKDVWTVELDALWYTETADLHPLDVRTVDPRDFLEGCDAVVYLAAVSNDPMGSNFEYATHEINALSCVRLASRAKQMGISKFVFASSCSMYGFSADQPRKESDKLNPLTAYARSKVWAEEELIKLADANFHVGALRFATACGSSPNLRLDLVLNDFVASAVTKSRIEILSDGSPWRPLIHVEDMARAIHWALTTDFTEPYLAINIGSDQWTYKIKDLADLVCKLIPNIRVTINASASPDRRSYKVDFTKFKKLAPYDQPQITLADAVHGLAKQIQDINIDSVEDFRKSIPFIRLVTLNSHITENRMNDSLYWIKN